MPPPWKALFVTATGTEIGKTFITAGVIRALRAQGKQAGAIKPVMSGYDRALPGASDAGLLLAAMGLPVTEAAIAAISPWRFAAPISPDMAAAREGRALDLPEILGFCRRAIAAAPGALLVEGVGGAMVPLDARHTLRDWMRELALPVLLVAGSYLGTISHTLTTAEALRAAGVAIAGVVVNESPHSPVPPEETAQALARFLPGTRLFLLPRDPGAAAFEALARLLAG